MSECTANQRVDWAIDRALVFEDAMRGRLMEAERQTGVQESLKKSIGESRDRLQKRVAELEAKLAEAQARYELAESILLFAPQGQPHNTLSGFWLSESYRPWWIGRLRSTALAPQAPEKCPRCGGRRGRTVADDENYMTWHDCPACLGGKK